MIDLTTTPTRNPEVLGRMADDEAVLVMPQKGQVKVLNEVGSVVWELIDGKRNILQIVEEICVQFDVDKDTVEADIIKFVADLVNREIIFIPTS